MKQIDLEKLYLSDVKATDAKVIFQEMDDIIEWNKEVFVVFYLNACNGIISREIVSVGILNATLIHAREIYKSAITHNAHSIIISHNHPSGDPKPSEEDIEVTKNIFKAGEIIGICLLDHVIVSKNIHFSFLDNNLF